MFWVKPNSKRGAKCPKTGNNKQQNICRNNTSGVALRLGTHTKRGLHRRDPHIFYHYTSYVFIYIYIYIYVFIHIYIYIYINASRRQYAHATENMTASKRTSLNPHNCHTFSRGEIRTSKVNCSSYQISQESPVAHATLQHIPR